MKDIPGKGGREMRRFALGLLCVIAFAVAAGGYSAFSDSGVACIVQMPCGMIDDPGMLVLKDDLPGIFSHVRAESFEDNTESGLPGIMPISPLLSISYGSRKSVRECL